MNTVRNGACAYSLGCRVRGAGKMGSGHSAAEHAGEVRSLAWRKSRKSKQGDCVEVARFDDAVFVRDSKDRAGPRLQFTSDQWQTFIGEILGETLG